MFKFLKFIDKNSARFGLIISITIPLMLFLTVFFIKYQEYDRLMILKIPVGKNIPKIFSICVFPNGLIFYFYAVRNKLKTMRGMIAGTILMAALMVILFLITGF
ncbi:MAG: hypothetical protein LBG92_00575 [Prevotellaceae bacterium]|jgi:hypothetical protein|nr:hypothetical protein [Prevotellaceae bacterium]